MSEPTTEAGRRMLADVWASALPGSPSHEHTKDYVLAIEAEARAPLAKAIRDLIWIESSDGSGWFCEGCLTHKHYAEQRVPHDPACRYIAADTLLAAD